MQMGQVYKLWKIKLTGSYTIFKTMLHNGS